MKVQASASGEVTYQWYSNTVDSTEGGTLIEGATENTYRPTWEADNITETTTIYYYYVAANGEYSAKSDIAAVVIHPTPMLEEMSFISEIPDLPTIEGADFGAHTKGYYYIVGDKTTPIGSLKPGYLQKENGVNIWPFSGNLDGAEHTITFASGSKPLFGYVREAAVKNLAILAPYIGGYASGGNTVLITNCTIEDEVKIGCNADGSPSETSSVGSFAGSFSGIVTNCVSYADVYGTNNVGGIAGNGYTSDSAPNSPCATIQNCYVTGTVTGADKVGGIFGGEGAVVQCWENGIGYIRNNHFYGTVKAAAKNGVPAEYYENASVQTTREGLIETILNAQLSDGGWALSGTKADVDMTGMALQALAPYYNTNEEVKAADDKALALLSSLQNADGGFYSTGTTNSEACVQVIVALTALSIDPETDERFVKDGNFVIDALGMFYVEGGGFKHVLDGKLDGMATEQGYYAMTAYARFLEKKTTLYDMIDVELSTGNESEEEGEEPEEDNRPSDDENEESNQIPSYEKKKNSKIVIQENPITDHFFSTFYL